MFTETENDTTGNAGLGMCPGGTLGIGTVMLTTTDSGFESNNLYNYSESNYNPSNSLRNTGNSNCFVMQNGTAINQVSQYPNAD